MHEARIAHRDLDRRLGRRPGAVGRRGLAWPALAAGIVGRAGIWPLAVEYTGIRAGLFAYGVPGVGPMASWRGG